MVDVTLCVVKVVCSVDGDVGVAIGDDIVVDCGCVGECLRVLA